MTFEEHGDRLIVRHRARVPYLRYFGFLAIFLLPCSMIMVVAQVMAPVQIAIACDRASNACTGSPVQAGWQPVTFPVADLAKVHLEESGGQPVIYLGEGSAGHYQLSNVADSPQTADALRMAVDQAHAFAAGNEPTFRVTYPAGKGGGVPYYAIAATFAFALVWLTQLLRAPRSLELIADRAKHELTLTRAFVRRSETQTLGFDALAKVVCRAGQNPLLSTVSLVLKDSKWVPVLDETAFPAPKADALQLTQKLASFAGVAAEGA